MHHSMEAIEYSRNRPLIDMVIFCAGNEIWETIGCTDTKQCKVDHCFYMYVTDSTEFPGHLAVKGSIYSLYPSAGQCPKRG